jgi:Fe2+ transport system protein FeoA
MTCALCGFNYESGGQACQESGCPLSFGGCRLNHCPRCGYTVPDTNTGIVGWLLGPRTPAPPVSTGSRRRLVDLPVGTESIVDDVEGPPDLAGQLTLLGVTPGSRLRLRQRRPSYVLDVEGTELALERSVAEMVWVR